jgi:cytidylate kinase
VTTGARVVTISATYGAGGAAIGLLLAERLGLPFADRLIKAHGGSPPPGEGVTEAELEEEPKGPILRSLSLLSPTWNLPTAPDEAEDLPERLRHEVEASISALVKEGGAVILGRGAAAAIGRDRPWAFHVRLDGPVDRRARRGALWEGIDVDDATERLRTTDGTRARYVQRVYGRDPADPKLYHLLVDATVITVDACVQLLSDAANDYWTYDDDNLPGAVARARTKSEELRGRRRD